MATFTTVKTIGTTGVFSTVQLWEDGAPAALASAEKSAAGTFLVAAFVQGENLTFVGSGATGKLLDTDSTGAGNGTYISYGLVSGNVAANDVATGATSGATCVISSGTPTATGCVWQGQCQNQEFSSATSVVSITGSTNSSTAYKHLTTAAGASFIDNANAQTNALRYNAANGAALKTTNNNTFTVNLGESFAQLTKLQIAETGTGGRAVITSGTTPTIDQCIMEGTYIANSATLGVLALLGTSPICQNSVIVQRATGADHIVGTGTASGILFSCTTVAPDDLATAPLSAFLSGASGSVTVDNCGMFLGDATKAIVAGSATFSFTTCYSDISGTTGVTQATYANEFQNVNDATRDFRLKTGAAQIDAGTAAGPAYDIVGTARPKGAAYDVGCWELIQAATFTIVKGDLTIAGKAEKITAAFKAVKADLTLSGKNLSITGAFRVSKGNLILTSVAARLTNSLPGIKGGLALSGKAASFSVGRYLAAVKGDLTLSGYAPSVIDARRVAKGDLTLAGKASRLANLLPVAKGNLTLSGNAAALADALRMAKGDLVLAGKVLTFSVGRTLLLVKGNLTLSGGASHVVDVRRIVKGDLVLNGQVLQIGQGQQFTLVKGNLLLTGLTNPMAAAFGGVAGHLALSGRTLPVTLVVRISKGDLTLSGKALKIAYALAGSKGDLLLSSQSGALALSYGLVKGDLTLTGEVLSISLPGAGIFARSQLLGSEIPNNLFASKIAANLLGSKTQPSLYGSKESSGLLGSKTPTDLGGEVDE